MPDEKGRLSEEEKKKVEKWLSAKWRGHPAKCQLCGNQSWRLGEMVIAGIAYTPGRFVMGGPTYPLLPLICSNCSQTVFLNAILCGVIEAERAEGKTDA